MSEARAPNSDSGGGEAMDLGALGDDYRAFVERATRYHEEHGVWPSDPLLDEVQAARRKIMAEHGNDWQKVVEYYIEEGKKHPDRIFHAPRPVGDEPSAG
jgi:hypothetical protein